MEGKVEFGLKVNWDRDKVTAELEEKDDEIRHLKEQITPRRRLHLFCTHATRPID
jgi:hypothetical protein